MYGNCSNAIPASNGKAPRSEWGTETIPQKIPVIVKYDLINRSYVLMNTRAKPTAGSWKKQKRGYWPSGVVYLGRSKLQEIY
jgi:hypothetical protein